jgi:hypothetical protein
MVVVHFEVEFTSPGDERGKRVLRQMARELLLMQCSDWPFLLFTVQTKEYTNERFHYHHQLFRKLIWAAGRPGGPPANLRRRPWAGGRHRFCMAPDRLYPFLAQRRTMDLADLRFPRQMEADGSAEILGQVLMKHTERLWSGGTFLVPVVALTEPLRAAVQKARARKTLQFGLEAISSKLKEEEIGIANVRERTGAAPGNRVSRLILFSNDGAERFYRRIERLLQDFAPRVLGCFLEADSFALGALVTSEERQIKAVMVEHKEAVSEILRAIVAP